MPFLSPPKLLVILVVALFVLGPDKLPKVARQIGSLWSDFGKLRARLEADVRGSFPDLPSTDTLSRAVHNPLSFLDDLAGTDAPGDPETLVVDNAAATDRAPVLDDGPPTEVSPPGQPVQRVTGEPIGNAAIIGVTPVTPFGAPPAVANTPDLVMHEVRVGDGAGGSDPGMN